jgi:hypothetical protein
MSRCRPGIAPTGQPSISAIRRATWLKALNPDLDPIRRAAGAIQTERAGVPVEIGTDLALFVFGTDEAQIEIAEFVQRQTDASIALFRQQSFRHKWMRELHPEGPDSAQNVTRRFEFGPINSEIEF